MYILFSFYQFCFTARSFYQLLSFLIFLYHSLSLPPSLSDPLFSSFYILVVYDTSFFLSLFFTSPSHLISYSTFFYFPPLSLSYSTLFILPSLSLTKHFFTLSVSYSTPTLSTSIYDLWSRKLGHNLGRYIWACEKHRSKNDFKKLIFLTNRFICFTRLALAINIWTRCLYLSAKYNIISRQLHAHIDRHTSTCSYMQSRKRIQINTSICR